MNLFLKTILAISLTFSFNTHAVDISMAREVADSLCLEVFKTPTTFNYDEIFSKNFREALPKESFQSLIQQVVEAAGYCLEAEMTAPQMAPWNFFKLFTDSGNRINIGFSLDPENPRLINGLLINDVELLSVSLSTWEDLEKRINSLEGLTSLTITKFGQENSSKAIRPNEMQPLGSTFKLYVLGAVADQVNLGKINWGDLYPIRDQWKSLPSGVMQDWEEGKMVSFKEFATHMIEISDNTATDHLINIIGRREIEKQLSFLGNNFESKNMPFLTTSEIFKLKWGAPIEMTNSFLNGSELDRRNILENEVTKLPLLEVLNNISDRPTLIKELEWFGSTENLCSAMKSIKNKNMPEVMEILSKNTPNIQVGSDSHWNYAGFKGGSEPGVFTMVYLLQNHNGEWGCVSMAWNNEKKALNFWIFNDLVKKILRIAENEI